MKAVPPKTRGPETESPPVPEPSAANRQGRRLAALVCLLLAAVLAFALTQGWRRRLLTESARYRSLVARAESARQEKVADERAVSALQNQLAEQPWNADARLELAQLKWQEGGPGLAAAALETAPRPFTDPRIPRMLSRCYRLTRREDRALATLNEGIRRFKEDGELRADRALLYVLLAWQQDAAREIKEAEALHAEGVRLARAALARARGDVRAARTALRAELSVHPEEGETKRQLAAVAQNAGETDEAIRLIRSIEARDLTPEDQVTLAVLLMAPKDPLRTAQALELLDTVLGAHPDYARARFIRARGLRQLGRLPEARQELERLCRDFPRMFGPSYELGEIYRKDGRTQEAGKLFRRHWSAQQQRTELRRAATTLMREPGSADAHLEAGRMFLERGLYGRAIVELQRSLSLKSGSAEAASLLRKAQSDIGTASGTAAPDADE